MKALSTEANSNWRLTYKRVDVPIVSRRILKTIKLDKIFHSELLPILQILVTLSLMLHLVVVRSLEMFGQMLHVCYSFSFLKDIRLARSKAPCFFPSRDLENYSVSSDWNEMFIGSLRRTQKVWLHQLKDLPPGPGQICRRKGQRGPFELLQFALKETEDSRATQSTPIGGIWISFFATNDFGRHAGNSDFFS